MKKVFALVLAFTIVSSALTIPAFADNQNYRTNAAATNDNDMDWNWLGLLGLAGLLGLRGRNRERT
ncbi:WGxxGxxG-CTERM domain-containing protein [Paenibacillus sp. N4]|uniref:WGxxGxxG family protein n=1 Tax=Paenibacillus vietnamensis TaxID=2590547 RepID=UPI001CD0BD6D|nr:WGxxGxxG family protein [Paenibacillus vietnamensis]MCA0757171.1 WGxxGxxG-CTERM domain-containing protein [Paenibacillus vietnamensis]